MGRKIPMWQVGLVMLFTILALCYAMDIVAKLFGDTFACGYGELHVPLILSAALAAIVAVINGYKWSFLEQGILASIGRSMQAILILMLIGMLIGSWIAAGIVPAMIYYGLAILDPSFFLFAGCLICCVVSLATGSAWTTAGTIGIALIGVGQGLGIEPAITAGAIVSGAYFGDKMSPLSDTTNLAPAIAGSDLFEHIRHMIWTATPSLAIALILFIFLGFGHSSNVDTSVVTALQDGIKSSFYISPTLLIPPLLVIVIVALKLPALPGLTGGVLLGCLFGNMFQGITIGGWFSILHHGYEFTASDVFVNVSDHIGTDLLRLSSDEFAEAVAAYGLDPSIHAQFDLFNLLSSGGMDSMMWTVSLIICAMCFGGIMDSSGMLATLANYLMKFAKNTGTLATITIFSCFFMNFISSDQYLSIILPGRMYKEAWEDRRLKPKNLSRCLEDSGTMTAPLVPWNTCGATMATFLGVPTSQYFKYAYLNIFNPLISIFYGFTGISMEKMSDEEYEDILRKREDEKAAAMAVLRR